MRSPYSQLQEHRHLFPPMDIYEWLCKLMFTTVFALVILLASPMLFLWLQRQIDHHSSMLCWTSPSAHSSVRLSCHVPQRTNREPPLIQIHFSKTSVRTRRALSSLLITDGQRQCRFSFFTLSLLSGA